MQADPYPSLFRHRPYDQNQEPKEHAYLHLWTLETLSSYLRKLRLLVLKCASAVYTNNRIMISFLGVRINYSM